LDVFASVNHIDFLIFSIKVYDLYFISYVTMIALVFFFLPFTFFYSEEALADADFDFELGEDEDDFLDDVKSPSFVNKVSKALRSTLVYIFCLLVLLVMGFLLSTTDFGTKNNQEIID